ncbi:MAG: peptidoglycan DD-metalloendopeptidase family protein [Actinobacteria bacterium]|nr:peptidoglycan DD-metalloendopeptidase family protein [Actinomycetota bacterium]
MKVISNRIAAIFVSLIVALSGLSVFSCPEEVFPQSIEDEIEEVKQQRKDTQKKIEEAKAAEQKYINEISQVEARLLATLSELDKLKIKQADAEQRVSETTEEIEIKEDELKIVEAELCDNIGILNNRVSYMYKNGSNHILELILSVRSFVQFNSNMKLVNLFVRESSDIVNLIKDKKNAVMSIKKAMIELREKQEDHEKEASRLVRESENKVKEIEELYGQKKNLLSRTKASKDQLIKMEAGLAEKENELIKILESYKYGIPPSGKLRWPAAGPVLSGFGYRIHPIVGTNRFHYGIDIGAPYGAAVVAAAGGEVIQAGYFGGYGYTVMIYHGGGYATWYAHLSSINVKVGQMIERGKTLGLVGSTGWSTGPHLHFEVRINGVAQNPMAYLK